MHIVSVVRPVSIFSRYSSPKCYLFVGIKIGISEVGYTLFNGSRSVRSRDDIIGEVQAVQDGAWRAGVGGYILVLCEGIPDSFLLLQCEQVPVREQISVFYRARLSLAEWVTDNNGDVGQTLRIQAGDNEPFRTIRLAEQTLP